MKEVITRYRKTIIYDLVFLIAGFTCTYIYNRYANSSLPNSVVFPISWVGAIAVAIIVIYLFPVKNIIDLQIYENKIAIIPFLLIEIIMQVNIFLNNLFGFNNSYRGDVNIIYFLIIQVGLSLTIFICYFFKIRLKDFHWNLSMKSIALVFLVYLIYEFVSCVIGIPKEFIGIILVLIPS